MIADGQDFVQLAIGRKEKPHFETWFFAARYSFIELEEYCRKDNVVCVILHEILRQDGGVQQLAQARIPLAVISKVVARLACVCKRSSRSSPISHYTLSAQGGYRETCISCHHTQCQGTNQLCDTCKISYISVLQR